MRQSLFLLSAGATVALGADTFQFFFPSGGEGVDPVAEIVSANPSTTIASIGCPADVDLNDCGWGVQYFQYTQISQTTYKATMSNDDSGFTMKLDCTEDKKKTQVACMYSVDSPENPMPNTDLTITGTDIARVTATVTKGANLLAGADAKETGTKSAGDEEVTEITGTRIPEETGAAGPTGTASGSAAQPEETGAQGEEESGAFRLGVEGSALLALVGAAALNAL